MTFDIEVHQNEYLAEGATEVNAVVRVTSGAAGPAMGRPDAAEVIIVDVSGSMAHPRTKIRAAREACSAAIGCIRDGVRFAVISGTAQAHHLYPSDGGLAIASEETRAEAAEAALKLSAGGGTVMSRWLEAADRVLSRSEGIKHAILLTDGKDESPGTLPIALAACEGHFQCDCRGIGADWEVAQLRRIATALLGDVGLVRSPDELVDDFTDLMERAMGRSVADVALRVWSPLGASVELVRQVAPTIDDLTRRRADVGERVADYPTGAWGDEVRDYHLCVQVPARQVDEEMLAARVSIVVDGAPVAEGKVRAVWTSDRALSTQLNPHVVRSTGYAEYADVVQRGIAALRDGDERTATTNLGRAAQLANALGDGAKLEEVSRVVHIDDVAHGTVRLRRDVDDLDAMELDTRSTRTTRIGTRRE